VAALSLAELRHLARLVHQGVGGARERLAALIADHADDLPGVVGFAPEQLERLARSDDPVALLVATLDRVPEARRRARSRQQQKIATSLVTTLVDTACRDEAGAVHVDARLLAEVATRCGTRALRFGDGAVETSRVRALLRACRGVPDLDVAIGSDRLVVRYAGRGMHGAVTLWLFPISPKVEALRVPLERVPQHQPASDVVAHDPPELSTPTLPTVCEVDGRSPSEPPDVPAASSLVARGKERGRPRGWQRFFEVVSHHFGEAA
jgi:hypothetical protein